MASRARLRWAQATREAAHVASADAALLVAMLRPRIRVWQWRSASGCGVVPLAGRGGVVAVLWALAAVVGLWRCALARADGAAVVLWPGACRWVAEAEGLGLLPVRRGQVFF
ncbi:hypothetical protein ABEX25_29720 [Paenibacillus thiaminolyticus]|uniref:hypothetical protein n=1 Tax=Paenibacillus thiaminolyticus TaxID=49283 RepID=UPI003D2AC9BD